MNVMIDRIAETLGAAAIERLAHIAVRQIPRMFRDHLADVVVRVEEFADSEALDAVGLNNPWDLVGLYQGRTFSEQSIWASGDMPSVICLFRRPLLLEWSRSGASLEDVVTHVIVHEVGHHFGLTDEQMQAIEDDPA